MKKIIFKNILLYIGGLLLSECGTAQTSHDSAKHVSANQVKITANKSQGWRQLFNGKDLTGWKHVGKGDMMIEDGMIHGKGGMGLLYWTKEKFGNCTLRVVYRMQKENSNSGVFIRIPIEPREEWMTVFYGYEVQIDNHPEPSGED